MGDNVANCTRGGNSLTDLELDDGSYYSSNSSTNESCLHGNTSVGRNEEEINPFYFYEFETLACLWVLLLFVVVGNSAVLAALMMTKTQRKSRMNFFIMHLALADLSVGLINILTDIVWKMTVHWYLGNVACKIIKYFQTVVVYASNYVLVALSIDRYDAITHPLRFSGSWRRARLLIASAWLLSFMFASPALLLFHEEEVLNNISGEHVTQCWVGMEQYQWRYYITIIFVVLFMIPAIIIAVCYTIMVHTIWTQSRILTPQGKKPAKTNGILRKSTNSRAKPEVFCGGDDDSRRASSRGLIPKAKIKSVKMTFVIVFVFILCSGPWFVYSLLQVYDYIPKTQTMAAISTLFTSLNPLNSAANPIIYCLFSTHICRNLRKNKIINWLAMKMCPTLGKPSPTAGNKRRFGPAHQDISQKTRTDSSSMTDSLMSKSGRSTLASSNRYSSIGGPKRHVDATCFINKEVHFEKGQKEEFNSVRPS